MAFLGGAFGEDDGFYNFDPSAGFWRYLSQQGLIGLDPYSNFAQQQYTPTYGGYLGQLAENPDQGFFDYLGEQQPDFRQQFSSQPAYLRGDTSARRLTPRVKYLGGA